MTSLEKASKLQDALKVFEIGISINGGHTRQMIGLVGSQDMHSIAIQGAKESYRPDPHTPCCLYDATGDLSSVGNQQLTIYHN